MGITHEDKIIRNIPHIVSVFSGGFESIFIELMHIYFTPLSGAKLITDKS